MDNVPVKIAENYKPPPRVYQLPQAIANRLSLSPDHYNAAPQYAYDFGLESKVLAKIPEWRTMRECEREARRERKERREQQRLRAVEAQQKQLLGAVSYPSAEELSSSDSDDAASTPSVEQDCEAGAALTPRAPETDPEPCIVAPAQTNSFHNILQPTILSRRDETGVSQVYGGKHASSFNYRDFEDDTSSPFDNIELKTINDLDILAQVLHQTQLKAKSEQSQVAAELKAKEHTQRAMLIRSEEEVEKSCDSLNAANDIECEVTAPTIHIKSAGLVQHVVFSDAERRLQNEQNNIPIALDVIHSHHHQPSSNYALQTPPVFAPYSTPRQEQQHRYIPYNNQLFNGVLEHHTHTPLNYGNYGNSQQHYGSQPSGIAPSVDCNGVYYSPTHAARYVAHNANNIYQCVTRPARNELVADASLAAPLIDESTMNSKSKSVPDILRELSDEVRNSELRRRNRNLSYNLHDLDQPPDEDEPRVEDEGTLKRHRPPSYTQLEVAARRLAKNISMMGFPLERVAKIVQRVGTDDKKIIEHLIPLSELMDLGFDEAKISDALLRFENNKEKALEYLIS